MRLLIVSYFYAPADSPRAYRWTAIAEHWAGQGHEVDIICARGLRQAEQETMNGVRVHRVSSRPDSLRTTVRKQEGTSGGLPHGAGARGPAIVKKALMWLAKRLYDQTWSRVYWPDHACLWYLPAVRKGIALFGADRYDGLISVSIPFTSHLVALRLRRAHSHVRWVADIGDPFSLPGGIPQNNQRLYAGRNARAEMEILRLSDAVVFTAAQARERYVELLAESAAKMHVIPPLLSTVEEGGPAPPVFPQDGKVRLVFVGTLYRAIRNPAFLLRLFVQLLDTGLEDMLELHFFGDVKDCWPVFTPYRYLMGTRISLHGFTERRVVLRAMREANVLVNIGNRTAYQLPSKVVEYASAGKPILNLVSTPEDASAEFLRSYPAALSVSEDDEGPEQVGAVVRFIHHPPAVVETELQRWLAKFSTEAIASAYATRLSQEREMPGVE